MKTFKFTLVIILLAGLNTVMAQKEAKPFIKTVNGNEFIIQKKDNSLYVVNKKYVSFKKSDATDIDFDGETLDEFGARRAHIKEATHRIISNTLDIDKLRHLERKYGVLTVSCYFDSNTKDYIGIEYSYSCDWADIFTLEKLDSIDSQLQKEKINAGKTNLLDDGKYFSFDVAYRVGTLRE